jgi:hypothetical protein
MRCLFLSQGWDQVKDGRQADNANGDEQQDETNDLF